MEDRGDSWKGFSGHHWLTDSCSTYTAKTFQTVVQNNVQTKFCKGVQMSQNGQGGAQIYTGEFSYA